VVYTYIGIFVAPDGKIQEINGMTQATIEEETEFLLNFSNSAFLSAGKHVVLGECMPNQKAPRTLPSLRRGC